MIDRTLLEHLFETGAAGFEAPEAATGPVDAVMGDDLAPVSSEIAEDASVLTAAGDDLNAPFRKSASLTSRGDDQNEVLSGSPASDRLFGEGGDDTLKGLAGNDALFGGDGDDRLVGGGGDDNIVGGAGDDKMIGGGGDDTLKGQAGADNMRGGGGDDILKGQAGDDVIKGNAGSDFIVGGGGNDTIIAGPGDDTLKGGGGNDIFEFAAKDFRRPETTEIRAFQFGRDKIDLVKLGIASFSDLDLTQDGANTILSIDRGQIVFVGRNVNAFSADDFLLTQADRSRVDPDPSDPFTGTDGPDTLESDAGDNLLQGFGGNDILGAGAGSDTLIGGTGADIFVVRLVNGEIDPTVDIIEDFSYISNDRIGLTEALNGISFSDLRNVVEVRIDGNDSIVGVRRGEAAPLQDVFILQGVQFTTDDLINYGFTAPPNNTTEFVDNPYGFENRTLVTSDPDATADGAYVVWVDKQNLDGDPLDFNLADINDSDDRENRLPSRDVFIMNTSTGIIQRVNIRDEAFPDAEALSPAISANGRIVAYVQETGDNTQQGNVFVRDMSFPDSAPILVSVDANGEAAGGVPVIDLQRGNLNQSKSNISVSTVDISADGSKVVFASRADLTGANQTDTNGSIDIYLRDLNAGTTTLVSELNGVAQGVIGPYTRSEQAAGDTVKMSADGRYILFSSFAAYTSGETDQQSSSTDIYLADTATGEIIRITTDAVGLAGSFDISADGTRVVFATKEAIGDDTNGLSDVFIADIDLASFEVTSRIRASEADGRFEVVDGSSYAPIISDDGDRIAFLSDARDLTDFDPNGTFRENDNKFPAEQLYILDLETGALTVPPSDIALTDSDSMINHAVLVDDGIIFRKEVDALPDSRRSIADTLERAVDVAPTTSDVPEGDTDRSSSASSTKLEDNITVRSSIDSATDNDVFQFDNTGSQQTTFGVSVEGVSSGGGTLADPKLSITVVNPLRTFNRVEDLNSGNGDDAFIRFDANFDATYFIRVESEDGSTGSYRLRIDRSLTEPPEPTEVFGATIFDL